MNANTETKKLKIYIILLLYFYTLPCGRGNTDGSSSKAVTGTIPTAGVTDAEERGGG